MLTDKELEEKAFEHTKITKRADLAFVAGYQAAMQENEKLIANLNSKLCEQALIIANQQWYEKALIKIVEIKDWRCDLAVSIAKNALKEGEAK